MNRFFSQFGKAVVLMADIPERRRFIQRENGILNIKNLAPETTFFSGEFSAADWRENEYRRSTGVSR